VPSAAAQTLDPDELLVRATALEDEGKFLDAARTLERLPRSERDDLTDVRIVQLRHKGFVEAQATPVAPRAEAEAPVDRFPGALEAPEVGRDELTPELLASALHHHGCLLVRGLLAPGVCEQLRSDIDEAFAAFDELGPFKLSTPGPWFARLDGEGYEPLDPLGTAFLRTGGGVYAPLAPRAFIEYRQALDDAGVLEIIHEKLNGTPVVSVNKCVLRRIGGGAQPTWHQDAYYLGENAKALNLWLSLSTCGADTDVMGLEILPGRQHRVAQQGTHNAVDERAVAHEVVQGIAQASGRPIYRPLFEPGDGILFDHLFLHRSDVRPLPRERYAVESWFFTADEYPEHLIPVVAG
jgi:hypothetical protein